MKTIPAIAFIVGIAFFIGSFAATVKQAEVTDDRAALCENQDDR
jgi:hypothetical protein